MAEFKVQLDERVSTIVTADDIDLIVRKDGAIKFYSVCELRAECPAGRLSMTLQPGESVPRIESEPVRGPIWKWQVTQ